MEVGNKTDHETSGILWSLKDRFIFTDLNILHFHFILLFIPCNKKYSQESHCILDTDCVGLCMFYDMINLVM